MTSTDPSEPLHAAEASASLLRAVRIVLVNPSHYGNVGSVARAMKTMGLVDLRLVAPRFADALTHPQAIALATGASDILESARMHATLDEAIGDCEWSAALTARARELAPAELAPRAAAQIAVQASSQGQNAAFVFGSERYGLDNASVIRCLSYCTIPTSPTYSSLNLAMAVQLIAYECHLAVMGQPGAMPPGPTLATHAERELLFAHLERALLALRFLDPEHHTKLMHRLRRLFGKISLERDEINILRGVCTAILENRP